MFHKAFVLIIQLICLRLFHFSHLPFYRGNFFLLRHTCHGTTHPLENLEKWEYIFQSGKGQGILNIPEKSGNFTPKYWKSQAITSNFIQNTGKWEISSQFYFYYFADFNWCICLNRFLYLLNSWIKTLKNTGKWKKKKNTGKVRKICRSGNVGTMYVDI